MRGTERPPFFFIIKLLDAIHQGSLVGEGETYVAPNDFVRATRYSRLVMSGRRT